MSVVCNSVVSDFHYAVHEGRSHHLLPIESLTDRIHIMERVRLLPVCCCCVHMPRMGYYQKLDLYTFT